MRKNVLFVGHTDRKAIPLCVAFMSALCQEKEVEGYRFFGCGFWADEGERVSDTAARVAAEVGIDLSEYAAHYAADFLIQQADLIIPQDEMILRGLKSVLKGDMSRVAKPFALQLTDEDEMIKAREQRDDILAYCEKLTKKLAVDFHKQQKILDTLQIVALTHQHIPDIRAIEETCFSHPWTVENIQSELEKPDSIFIGAIVGERVIGYGSLNVVCGVAYINNIAVLPAYRKWGIGKRIMHGLEQAVLAQNPESITLEVRSQNTPAIAMYQSFGFQPAGLRPGFYRDPPDDGLILTKEF